VETAGAEAGGGVVSSADGVEAVVAYLRNLEKEEFTGRVELTLDFNKGGISRLQVMRADPTVRWPRSKGDES